MELCEGGDLHGLMTERHQNFKPFTEEEAATLMKHIL